MLSSRAGRQQWQGTSPLPGALTHRGRAGQRTGPNPGRSRRRAQAAELPRSYRTSGGQNKVAAADAKNVVHRRAGEDHLAHLRRGADRQRARSEARSGCVHSRIEMCPVPPRDGSIRAGKEGWPPARIAQRRPEPLDGDRARVGVADEAGDEAGRRVGRRSPAARRSDRCGRCASRRCGPTSSSPRPGHG